MKLIKIAAAFAFLTSMAALAAPTHPETIVSILEKESDLAGKLDVEVTYLLHCGDTFNRIATRSVPPISLSNPHISVRILATNSRICQGADQKAVTQFRVNKIAGAYTFIAVQPTR